MHDNGPNRGYGIDDNGQRYIIQLTHNWDFGPENSATIEVPSQGTGWRHLMFTYDGSSQAAGLKFYINGELQKAKILKDSLTKSIRVKEPFVIGSRNTAWTARARAAHVRLIPREFTAAEVRHFAKTDRPPGDLP